MSNFDIVTSRKKIAKFVRRQMRGSDIFGPALRSRRLVILKDRPRWLPEFIWMRLANLVVTRPREPENESDKGGQYGDK